MRDSLSNTYIRRAHSPYYYQGNTQWNGQTIDRQGYDSLYFVIGIGEIADADATFAVVVHESDDDTTYTAVAAADLVSQTAGTAALTAASFQFDDDNKVKSIGYIGAQRYVRLYITPTGNTGQCFLSVTAHLSKANLAPVTH